MNGIIDALFITIVTSVIGIVLVLMFKALESCLSNYLKLAFYYRFLCVTLVLYGAPIVFVLFRLCCRLAGHPVVSLFGMATPVMHVVFIWLAMIWLAGMAVMLIRQGRGFYFLFRTCQNRMPVPCRYRELLDEVRKEMGIRRQISIYRSYRSGTAFITGLIHPTIYLPVREIDNSDLRMIFLHELKHYQQGDILLKIIEVILGIVYWFCPLYFYTCHICNMYTEANNDSFCTKRLDNGRRYYHTLVDFADISANDMGRIVPGLIEESDEIMKRVALVRTHEIEKTKLSIAAIVIAFSLVACSATAYGATSAIQYGYNQAWHETMVGEEEELVPVPELEEYEGTLEDLEGLTVVEELEQEVKGRSGETLFSCKLMNQSYYRSPVFSKKKDGTVRVSIDVTPTNKEVTVGIIKPDRTTTFVKGKGTIAHTFTTPTTGSYQVFIANYSGSVLSIAGYYK